MPKLKSHSGASKRFQKRGSGSIKRRAAYRNHILTKKSTKQKRHLRVDADHLSHPDQRLVERMLQGS